VGVPVTVAVALVPVAGLRVKPGGSDPVMMDQAAGYELLRARLAE
jgi:hypothetical protein